MTTVNPRRLGDALRAGAHGIHPLEAATSLLIDCGSWLHRTDFTSRFTTIATSVSVTLLATTDWEAAVTALHAGELPASGGERRMLLLASSIAAGTLVSLNDALPGIDRATRASPSAPGVYTHEEVAMMLRQAADYPPPGRDGNLPLVILEPVGDGLYRITGELSDEQAQPEPGDDAVGVPDDNPNQSSSTPGRCSARGSHASLVLSHSSGMPWRLPICARRSA
jgi:hypothetical protein